MEPEANGSFSDPFLAHLVLILSIYQFDLPRSPIPRYDGPSTWQTDNILRALNTISNRMYTAEDTLAFIKASENWENNLDAKKRHGLGDIPQPSNPSAELSQGSLSSAPPFPSFNVATSLKTSSSSGTPLVVPPSPPSNTAFETDKSAVDELRLVKAQVSDIVRVCDAVARGDLSHKITVPVQDAFMAKVKDVINGMVDKLVQFAKEVTRVSHEFGTQCIFGGHACMDGVQGIWADLTINLNKMASNITNRMRSISEVTKAVAMGDLSKRVQVDAQGEMLDLKMTVNSMVNQLSVLANEVTRVSLQVGTEGILGGQAAVPDVQGIWKVLTDNVNLMAMNMTNQVHSIVEVANVTSGDLTKAIEVDVRGELLDLNQTVNGMTESLSGFANEVTRVVREVGAEGLLGRQANLTNVNGAWKDLTDYVNVMAANTQVNRMVFNLRDNITNAVARGAAELVKRRKSASELLGYVAHEIKDPMNDIIGMTKISLESELNRSERENWLLVQMRVRSLLLIIDDLSDISKLETSRMVMEQVSFSFRQTVFGILKTLVVRAAGNNVDLIYDVDPDIPDQLIGDFLRLQQVITNLVSNAIKFTSPGVGHVSLSCRRLALDHSTVTLEVCVSDNGIGIAKDKLNLISDAFAQAGCSTIREYESVGLGLSISKCLVSLMGGTMWVESVVGEGSKFFFTITSQIGQLSMDATLPKIMSFGNRNILFVDTQYDRTGAADRIQELRLKPYVIHNLLEVADKATCPHIDIIFVDSLSVTETIREYEHLRQIPIVLLAPDLPRLNLKWCYDNGIHSGVTTPLSAQDLASVLIPSFESSPVAPTNDVKFDILFAEDNLVNQKVVVKTLLKYGHAVEIVESGSLAVDAFKARVGQNRPFDIILMNVSLPIMGGMETTESIRAYETHNNLTPTPIIAVTAHTMIGDRERYLDAGMDGHITRPLRRGDLLNSIAKFASERARQRGHPIPVDVP